MLWNLNRKCEAIFSGFSILFKLTSASPTVLTFFFYPSLWSVIHGFVGVKGQYFKKKCTWFFRPSGFWSRVSAPGQISLLERQLGTLIKLSAESGHFFAGGWEETIVNVNLSGMTLAGPNSQTVWNIKNAPDSCELLLCPKALLVSKLHLRLRCLVFWQSLIEVPVSHFLLKRSKVTMCNKPTTH